MTQPFVVQFNPVAVHLGPLQVHWYGLMYLLGFLGGWLLGEYRRKRGRLPVSRDALGDMVFYLMMGLILGGRIWYMLFYYAGGPKWLWTDPLALVRVWDGGMSFHGGLLGVLVTGFWWSRRHRLHFFDTVDFIAPLVPRGRAGIGCTSSIRWISSRRWFRWALGWGGWAISSTASCGASRAMCRGR